MPYKALFLCSKLADYFLHTIKIFAQEAQAAISIVRLPNQREAPYQYDFPASFDVRLLSDFESEAALADFCRRVSPDFVFVAGWSIKAYSRAVDQFRGTSTPVVLGLDNPWQGNWRQIIGSVYFRLLRKKYYQRAWVAGSAQYTFARMLGFEHAAILPHLYAANPSHIAAAKPWENKPDEGDKILLFVGRLVAAKGIKELYRAFDRLQAPGWQLWIVGNGELEEELPPTAKIKRIDFLQPKDLVAMFHRASAACLPSHLEHWGLVVQEFALAGLPMLLSDQVHAGQVFLVPGYNGYTFPAGNEAALQQALQQLLASPSSRLQQMGEASRLLATKINSQLQARILMALLEELPAPSIDENLE